MKESPPLNPDWISLWLVLSLFWAIPIMFNGNSTLPTEQSVLASYINQENKKYQVLANDDLEKYRKCIMPDDGKYYEKRCSIERGERTANLNSEYEKLSNEIAHLKDLSQSGYFKEEVKEKRNSWIKSQLLYFSIPIGLLAIALKLTSFLFSRLFITAPENSLNLFLRKNRDLLTLLVFVSILFSSLIPISLIFFNLLLNMGSFAIIRIGDMLLLIAIFVVTMFISSKKMAQMVWARYLVRFTKALTVISLMSGITVLFQRQLTIFVFSFLFLLLVCWVVDNKTLKPTIYAALIWGASIISPLDVRMLSFPYKKAETGQIFTILRTSYGLMEGPSVDGYMSMGCLVPIYPPEWIMVFNPWPLLTITFYKSN